MIDDDTIRIDRSTPRFGPGWVEFEVRDMQGTLIGLLKQDVPIFIPSVESVDTYEARVELTRTNYRAALNMRELNKADQRREAAKASR